VDGKITRDSAAVDPATGLYSLANIPAGTQGELVLVSPDTSQWFHRINNYNLPEFVQSLNDTLIEGQNTLLVPRQLIIPQTENDPAPATITANPSEVTELVGPADQKNGEEIARFENRIYLTNFGTPADSAYFHTANEAIDSLFYFGQGSPLILVSNQINISAYHQINYNINNGFPNELGWNVTRGGGNITSPLYSNAATGLFILGGQINITGDLADEIKEIEGRRLQLGDVTSRVSFMNPNPSLPNIKDRAYVHAILINQQARVMTGNEIFSLNGLSTTLQTNNPENKLNNKTYYIQPEQLIHNE